MSRRGNPKQRRRRRERRVAAHVAWRLDGKLRVGMRVRTLSTLIGRVVWDLGHGWWIVRTPSEDIPLHESTLEVLP